MNGQDVIQFSGNCSVCNVKRDPGAQLLQWQNSAPSFRLPDLQFICSVAVYTFMRM